MVSLCGARNYITQIVNKKKKTVCRKLRMRYADILVSQDG